MMKPEPKIKTFIDDEEKALHDAIEADGYQPGKNLLTPEEKARLKEIARYTIHEERAKISLRIPKSDLARLKAMAIREGIPYQTLISSILHKAARQ